MKQQTFLRLAILAAMYTGLSVSCKKDLSTSKSSVTTVPSATSASELIQTPYGLVPASRVHEVDNQTVVDISGGRLHLVDLHTRKLVRDLGALSNEDLASKDPYAYASKLALAATGRTVMGFGTGPGVVSSRLSNGISNRGVLPQAGGNYPGYFLGADATNIQSFSTKWIVPKKPLDTTNIVTTFLWNGLDGGALQPVLQWDQGQGPNYTIANWYFVNGNYFHGTFVPVAVGAQLEGVITYISNTGGNWTYKESFTGYPTADVTVVRPTEATSLAECWEAYTSIMSKWPAQPAVAMNNIHLTLRSGVTPDTVHWYGINDGPVKTPTGYNSVVVNNSSSNGEVDFYFGDSTGITPDSTYKIISAVNNSSVLDVTASGTTDGTKVELWSNNVPSSNNQKWKVFGLGNGYYKLLPLNAPTKVMDISGGGTANGTQVDIYTDNGTSNQQWKIVYAGNGYCTLIPASAPSSALDVNGGSSANGTKVQIYTANGGNAQKFKFVMQ